MSKDFVSIKNWAEDDRPREKVLQKGIGALSDAELLTILISSGTKDRSAMDLAKDVLAMAHNSIHELGKLNLKELQQTKGIGEARAITISAALELGRRRQGPNDLQRASINSSKSAAEIVMPLLRDLNHEVFLVLYLNQSAKLIKQENISSGGLTATVADIRLILKNALLYQSNQIIVAHNHPSGNLQPSNIDKELTRKLKDAAALMDIKLLDHLIIAGNNYFSFGDEGLL